MKKVEKPSYNLEAIKQAFNSVEKLNMTYSAMQGQYELGFSDLYIKFQIDKRGEMIVSFKQR